MTNIEELLCRMAADIPKKDAIIFLYEKEFNFFDRVEIGTIAAEKDMSVLARHSNS
jgi:phospholipase C